MVTESINGLCCFAVFFNVSAPIFHGTIFPEDGCESCSSGLFLDLSFFNNWIPCFFHMASSSFFVAGGKRGRRSSDWLLWRHGTSTDNPPRGILSVGGELDSRRLLPVDVLLQGTCCVAFLLPLNRVSCVSVIIESLKVCESSVAFQICFCWLRGWFEGTCGFSCFPGSESDFLPIQDQIEKQNRKIGF